MRERVEVDPVRVDVGGILRGSVATLYSHLVTRPTGRAVRIAIEAQLDAERGRVLSLVDFSQVQVLDFSCADEIVAKLLKGSLEGGPGPDAFFLFRGVEERHLGPIEAVLARHALAAVVKIRGRGYELVGSRSRPERRVWDAVEEAETVPPERARRRFSAQEERGALLHLVRRRLVLPFGDGGCRALSSLVSDRA